MSSMAGRTMAITGGAGNVGLAIIRMALARRDERRKNAGDAPAFDASNDPAIPVTPSESKGFPSAKRASETAGQAAKPRITFDTIFERRAFLPSVFILLVNMGFGCVTTFIALHAAARGVEHVSLYFLVYAITTLVTRPGIGRLIDRFGYRIPAILATLCTAGTLVLIGLASTLAAFATAGLFAGLGIGTAMGTFQSMAVASVEPNRRGVATATYMTFFDIGIAVGAGLGGVIAGALGYGGMYMVVAAFPAMAALLAALLVKPGVGVSSPQGPGNVAK